MKKRATLAEKRLNAYRRLFSTEDGKIVLGDLMKSCFMYSSTIAQNPYDTYFNEGMRSAILRIIQTANISAQEIERIRDQLNKESEDLLID
jgi:hypothetical protein